MTQLKLTNAGKRFRFEWIFRELTHEFRSGVTTALLGPNGSGKSSLMKVLSGHLSLTKGQYQLIHNDGKAVAPDRVYEQVAYAAPYIELIEEFTLREALDFHLVLRPWQGGNTDSLLEKIQLPGSAADKEIRFFSSGMKQRVKLALAICSDAPVLLIDEPTTNLDVQATQWFHNLLAQNKANRLVVIASNDPSDLALCTDQLNILDFKGHK
jgi:ABC-type multidrug transport system ATPase subunit